MRLQLRAIEPNDVVRFAEIAEHPAVAAQQYPNRTLISVSDWTQRFLTKKKSNDDATAIVCDDEVVGYLLRFTYHHITGKYLHYGWDLHPDYWGRGIMPAALCLEYAERFREPYLRQIQVDCFHDNRRCLRVLEKLGHRRLRLALHHRLYMMYCSRCLRWVVRHGITREMWVVRPDYALWHDRAIGNLTGPIEITA